MELIHVGRFGLTSLRYVVLASNDVTSWHHKVISAWNGVDSFIWRPLASLNACWKRNKIPAAPAMADTVLIRVPSSWCQRQRDHQIALGGMLSIR